MALVGPGAMEEYTGGPSQQRRRGFVTVNEPAQGFFVTGSTIDGMNGVYGRVGNESVWSSHTVLLAYRNDDHRRWVMALVEHATSKAAQYQKLRERRARRRARDSSDSSSEEEDTLDEREWLLIDQNGRDRFKHDGDTIIPGAGVSWKHLHRGHAEPAGEKRSTWSGSTSVEVQGEDDDDELPWQVIAILDRQTMRDMRYTQQCYENNVKTAMSGKNLPKPSLAGIEDKSAMGSWLFRVTKTDTVEVHCEPSANAPNVGVRQHGEYLQGVERRGSWLRIEAPPAPVKIRGRPPSRDIPHWVLIEDEDGSVHLTQVAEEDMPDMEAEPVDRPEADIFDRPFEPRLEDPNAPEEVPKDEAEAEAEVEAEIVFNEVSVTEDVFSLPPRGVELAMGAEVMLESLAKEGFNGLLATIATKMSEDGRQGVFLSTTGQKFSLKVTNLCPLIPGESGPLARHARVLGLSLGLLGLASDDCKPVASARKLLAAAVRAAERDIGPECKAARQHAEAAHEALANALAAQEDREAAARAATPAATPAAASTTPKASAVSAEPALAQEVAIEPAVGADPVPPIASSDAPEESDQAASAEGAAAVSVVGAEANSESQPPRDAAAPPVSLSPARAPHEVVEAGALGARAAQASKLCCADSVEKAEEGVAALRTLLVEEQSRARRANRSGADGDCEDGEGADSLRLRLTLIRGLLRVRRDLEASREAHAARSLHPSSAAATLWSARCQLRIGGSGAQREEGLYLLSLVPSMPPSCADDAWAVGEAKRRLLAARRAERGEGRAKDAYARGLFSDAAKLYGEAVENANILADDKWQRAELHANKAACHRRAREFRPAIADLDIALGLFPRFKRAIFRRGVCLLEAGAAKASITAFETLLGMQRDWPNIIDWLVRAHAAERRGGTAGFKDFYAGYSSGSKAAPSDAPNFQDSGGWAEAATGNDIASEKNHYTVLGVPADATEKQLKRAYRIMSLKFHPDKEGGSTRAFQRVATAYQTLTDPEKRQLYDDGADLKQKKGSSSDSDSDGEKEKKSLREEIERKYFPERYKFWPFGDPFVQKRKRDEKKRQRAGKPAFHQEDI